METEVQCAYCDKRCVTPEELERAWVWPGRGRVTCCNECGGYEICPVCSTRWECVGEPGSPCLSCRDELEPKWRWLHSVSARYEGGFMEYIGVTADLIVPPPNEGDLLAYYIASEAVAAWDEAQQDDSEEDADAIFSNRMQIAKEQLERLD